MPKQKQIAQVKILSPYQLEELVKALDKINPSYIALPPAATIEQRAMHQCQIQQFYTVVEAIKQISNGLKLADLETTYGANETK